MHRVTGVRQLHTLPNAGDKPVSLVSVVPIVAIMHAELKLCCKLHPHRTDHNSAQDVLMAAKRESTVQVPFGAYVQLFSKADLQSMPSHNHHKLSIELLDSKQLLWGTIYNLSEKELEALLLSWGLAKIWLDQTVKVPNRGLCLLCAEEWWHPADFCLFSGVNQIR